eukprot:Nitzschia sp. Nitz4//scaffold54_size114964//105702//108134//NITZ4_003873-RA/size114964-augustus-gene-0.25-mRNA-1//-1//CDS//3329554417//3072//frame0
MPKSTEGTVFVRFVPTPDYKVLRHQLEDIFSQIGPIKKSSWINSKGNDASKGYGFVKYLSDDDAKAATSELNDTKIQMEGREYRIKVELASLQPIIDKAVKKDESAPSKKSTSPNKTATDDLSESDAEMLKKKSRIILRNLSFYAKETHIRKALEKQFGQVVDVHVPKVQSNLHVGFCFVTFANPEDAQKAVEAKNIDIQKRTVNMDWSRTIFVRNIPFDTTRNDLFEIFAKFGYIESIYLVKDRNTGLLKGTAFITYKRHQSAEKAVNAATSQKTTEATEKGDFVSLRSATGTDKEEKVEAQDSSIMLRGRQIMVNFAVDRETASTFDSKEHNTIAADRRNMYLQAVARVESGTTEAGADNRNTWEDLPESDQKKRQTAFKDKNTKLQSPIFFINPNRLSFRNVAKHVDEMQLQKLIEIATKRGIQKGLVGAKDYIAHLRARGEMSTREILALVQDKEKAEQVIPPFEEGLNIKDYVPSVFIERDFGGNKKKSEAPSRGFGFAEFTHHVHALACLRELNNNPSYTREYVAGGKAADELRKKGRKTKSGETILLPRMIVDFTVENKIKARKQAERRMQQQLNASKQKEEREADKEGKKSDSKKRNRGAAQRERKRQERENGITKPKKKEKQMTPVTRVQHKEKKKEEPVKTMKPRKRQKTDPEEEKFQKLVKTHNSSSETRKPVASERKAQLKEGKRWFE